MYSLYPLQHTHRTFISFGRDEREIIYVKCDGLPLFVVACYDLLSRCCQKFVCLEYTVFFFLVIFLGLYNKIFCVLAR
jgi:hypothetical protein